MIRLWLLTLALVLGLAGGARADGMEDLRAGNEAFKQGRYEEAVDAYTRAIISGQLSAEALAVTFNNRGVAYGEVGDFDRAILDYNEALTLKPDDSTSIRNLRVAHVKRGVVQANLGEDQKALADYTKAIELDPSHTLAYLRRGELHASRGELDLALRDLEKAETLEPSNQEATQLLTRVRAELAGGHRPVRTETATAAAEPAAAPEPTTAATPASPERGAPPAERRLTVTAAPAGVSATSPSAAAQPAQRAEPARQQQAAAPATARPLPADARRVRVRQAVNMRAGPGNDFERLATLPGGAELPVLGVTKGWYELELQDGRRGFVYQSWLEPAGG